MKKEDKEQKAINELEYLSVYGLSVILTQKDLDQISILLNLLSKQKIKIDKAIKYIEANTCDEEIYGNNDNGDYYQTIQCLSLRGGEIGELLKILKGE